MLAQSGLGVRQDEQPALPPLSGIFLAQVTDALPSDHAVEVMLSSLSGSYGGSPSRALKVHVMEHRAGMYHGNLDLPRRGDWGLVVFPHGSDQLPVWIGSLYQDFNTLATANEQERISQHDSGVWSRTAKDGTVEWSHPSGTFIHVGTGTALSSRTRQERQGATRREVPYAIPPRPPITVHVQHSSGTLVSIDPTGNITVTGVQTKTETIAKAVTEHYQDVKSETVDGALTEACNATKQETVVGNVTENYQAAWSVTVGANGAITAVGSLVIQGNDVTIKSSNASPGAHMHLGGTTLEDFVAKLGGIAKIAAAFNGHTHTDPQGGSTGGPNTSITLVSGPDYSTDAKAS